MSQFKSISGATGHADDSRELKHARFCRTRTATGREHSVCQDSGVSHIVILIIHNREKVLSIVNVMCEDELEGKTAHFRLPSAFQNRACLSSPLLM